MSAPRGIEPLFLPILSKSNCTGFTIYCLSCHPDDSLHMTLLCYKKCERTHSCGHACPKKCYEDCGQCKVGVSKLLPCGHTAVIPCHLGPEEWQCQSPCERLLACGHMCNMKCSQQCSAQCGVQVIKTLPCGHNGAVSCYLPAEEAQCQTECGAELACGHACSGTCSKCKQGACHIDCQKECGRTLVCGK